MSTSARWSVIASIAAADIALCLGRDIAVTGTAFYALAVAVLLVLRIIYGRLRPDRRIAGLADSAVELIVYTHLAAILSYHAVVAGPPLVDGGLTRLDALLLFDWPSVFQWVHERPLFQGLLQALYQSLMPQVVILLAMLHFLGRHDQAEEFIAAFIATSLVCIAVSGALPAESAWVHFKVTNLIHPYHLEQFTALRADTLREIDLRRVEGLITFPSFHAALATIVAYAARGVRVLFPLALITNAGVVIATPTQGGHYLIDVVCGLAVAATTIAVLRRRARIGAAVAAPATGR